MESQYQPPSKFAAIMKEQLWAQVVAGLVLGLLVGVLLGPDLGLFEDGAMQLLGEWIALPGELFLSVLRFVVVPLVLSSVALGVADSDEVDRIKALGLSVVLYFLTTTTIAVTIGVSMAQIFKPGHYIAEDQVASAQVQGDVNIQSPTDALVGNDSSIPDQIADLLPTNPVASLAQGDMLAIVIASAIFGVALLALPRTESRPLIDLMRSTQAVCLNIVNWIMKFAPIAVFGLIADVTMDNGLEVLTGVSAYVLTVVGALAVMMVVYMIILAVVARRSPWRFLSRSREVLLFAFSSSSSGATMPLTLRTVNERHGVNPTVGRLVVPLGATINMDGTALYQAVATVFLVQVYGQVDFGLTETLLVLTLAIGASIGTAAIPGVGIVLLAAILTQVGVPEYYLGLVFAVDRILDMCRTMVNVTGDMVASVTLDRLLGFKHEDIEAAAENAPDAPTDPSPETDTSSSMTMQRHGQQ
ncbi:hypothetical protein CCR85_10950 [Rhodothalassium salexigens]|uniref:dicarboxylate/amino acid:cation symporter n=1 Tax=Rhodothalassium salexigens TaxID=1086 RepID=UPI0019137370|nr:dicarboxylate/amino acid:cation symporter [Rhodothalassium salexigens]MBK5912006.1 hypothetical protein [Rhodothalassium salexigens]